MSSVRRALFIWWHACRLRLDLLLPSAAPLWLRALFLPALVLPHGPLSDGVRVRRLCERLGPIFVKFGQLLSTRPDLLSAEMAGELAQLQDNVPPFASAEFRRLLEAGLGGKIEQLFAQLDEQPLASASLAQVHGARLPDGAAVAVKVIRPGVEKIIERDLRLLQTLAALLDRLGPDGRRLRAPEIITDYRHTVTHELNLRYEAANAQKLRDNFRDNPLNYTPKVHWDYVRENILVSERIDGIPVTDIATIEAHGIDLKQLAETGVRIFFTQVFEHNFFHADMHPGNIFVSKTHRDPPQYICVDCAIIGSLTTAERLSVATMLRAVLRRDYRRAAEAQLRAGWVAQDTPVHQLEAEIRTVCEPIFARPLREISFAVLLVSLFKTARRFDMQMLPSLVLLEKTIFNIEGLGRQIYPELDLWATLAPLFETWSRRRYSLKTMRTMVREMGPQWWEQAREIAPLLQRGLQRLAAPPSPPAPVRRRSRWGGLLAMSAGVLAGLLLAPWLPGPPGLASMNFDQLGWAVLALLGLYVLVRR
ncbi:MAG: 2-polyprenylphenol 6-hydroxylase [Cellvibrionales bacterium]|nr:2-polyprenylphenol 6-hydroxylase [Cellvibrionales bacterium]